MAPDTQHAAFVDIQPRAQAIRDSILATLYDNPEGMTSEELADKTGIPYASVQPRTSELSRGKFPRIMDSGLRRKARSGKNTIVWVTAA